MLLFEKKIHEELFIEGRGDFGDKNGVATVVVGLRLVAQIGMHAVPRFMGEGEDVAQNASIVH